MGFVIFGVFLGLMFGLGLFFLVLYPAIRERRQQRLENSTQENSSQEISSQEKEQADEKR